MKPQRGRHGCISAKRQEPIKPSSVAPEKRALAASWLKPLIALSIRRPTPQLPCPPETRVVFVEHSLHFLSSASSGHPLHTRANCTISAVRQQVRSQEIPNGIAETRLREGGG